MSRNDNDVENILRIVDSLNQRLTALEQIIVKSVEGKPVLERIRQPTHDLETNAKLVTDTGVMDITKVPVCSACHGLLKEGDHFFVCHHCDSVLCDLHAIIFGNKAHCEEDFRRHHIDVSRRDYKTLVCIANGIEDVDEIAELTSILPEDVEQSLSTLSTSNFINCETKLFGLLKKIKSTDDGLLAISVYRQFVYGKDEDMELFGKTLRKYLSEEKGFDVRV